MHRCAGILAVVVMTAGALAQAQDAPSAAAPAWAAAADGELAGLRGGLRAGRFDVEIGLYVRGSVDGQPVVEQQYSLGAPQDGSAPLGGTATDASGRVQFVHELTPAGLRLAVLNAADGSMIQHDAVLQLSVLNFSEQFGSALQRAGLALAESFGRAELPR